MKKKRWTKMKHKIISSQFIQLKWTYTKHKTDMLRVIHFKEIAYGYQQMEMLLNLSANFGYISGYTLKAIDNQIRNEQFPLQIQLRFHIFWLILVYHNFSNGIFSLRAVYIGVFVNQIEICWIKLIFECCSNTIMFVWIIGNVKNNDLVCNTKVFKNASRKWDHRRNSTKKKNSLITSRFDFALFPKL